MLGSELTEYTAHMIDEYYKNNTSLFLNALSERCLWIGPHEGQIIRSKAKLLSLCQGKITAFLSRGGICR